MINTLNETHLHKTLKDIYTFKEEGSLQEQKIGDFIADIVTKEGNIIEIQTGSLSHLKKKLLYFIENKKKVTVVYPLATQKYIQTQSPEGTTTRKSPLKKTIYSTFKELTGLYPILLSRYFTLEVLECTITETRLKTRQNQQSKNRRRRFTKDWQKTGKRLESIETTRIFHGKKSWLALLPKNLPQSFTSTDFYTALKTQGEPIKKQEASLMLWLYCHMGLLQRTGKKGRSFTYSL